MLCSRIAVLEKLFEQPQSDEEGAKLRDALLMYAGGLCSSLEIYTILVNLKASRNN